MIGAVVGVQPFGGEGLSGTGPKAGGPHFLRRLVRPGAAAAPDLATVVALPGPTGEANTLALKPRGRVACVAESEADLVAQARAAAATGNVALLPRTAAGERARAAVGAAGELADDVLAAAPDAVLVAGAADRVQALRVGVAARDGPLVPVVAAGPDGYDLWRLVSERTLTVNTTASGGNASLLSLAEEEPA